MPEGAKASKGDVLLMVGTRKGGFILTSDAKRRSWSLSGPHWPGRDVFHMSYDQRDGTTWAAVNSIIWGPEVQRSNDLGAIWRSSRAGPQFDDAKASPSSRSGASSPGSYMPGWSPRRFSGAAMAATPEARSRA